ncbi:MAG: redoxin domain-containing protein [Gemmatimonadota bacterium]|nr:MAG: redoxin domain-containing protein [Gemmatimonadota bacterium]
MHRWLSTLIVTATLLALATPHPLRAQEQIGIAVGATPDAVEIEDLDGNSVHLGDYIGGGKPLLIEFWATWCSLCEALEPAMLAAHSEYGDEVDFLVVAVAVNQSVRRVRRYEESHDVPGRFLWDTDGRAVRAFVTPSTSYVVALDAEGSVVYTGLGADQDIDAAVERALGR